MIKFCRSACSCIGALLLLTNTGKTQTTIWSSTTIPPYTGTTSNTISGTFLTPTYNASTQGVYLVMRAWNYYPVTGAGSQQSLQIGINNNLLDASRLVNKPVLCQQRDGLELQWCNLNSKHLWRLRYDPATGGSIPAEAALNAWTTSDIMRTGATLDTTTLKLDITNLVSAVGASNTLTLTNAFNQCTAGSNTINVQGVQIVTGTLSANPKPSGFNYGSAPSPTVPSLPVYTPTPVSPPIFTVSTNTNGSFNITIGSDVYKFDSAFVNPQTGQPTSAWYAILGGCYASGPNYPFNTAPNITWSGSTCTITAACNFYTLTRTLQVYSDHVDVSDTFSNLTSNDFRVGYYHECSPPATPVTAMISGLAVPTGNVQVSPPSPENPTIYLGLANSAVGILERDDAMRIWATKYIFEPYYNNNPALVNSWWASTIHTLGAPWSSDTAAAGVYNWNWGLAPNGTNSTRWSVFPLQSSAGYWGFVHTIRNLLNTNFAIPGSMSFTYTAPPFITSFSPLTIMTSGTSKAYLNDRSDSFIASAPPCQGNAPFSGQDFGPETLLSTQWLSDTKTMMGSLSTTSGILKPVKKLIYFNSELSTEAADSSTYSADCAMYSASPTEQWTYFGGPQPAATIQSNLYLSPCFFPNDLSGTTSSYGTAMTNLLTTLLGPSYNFDGIYWDIFSGDFNLWDTFVVKSSGLSSGLWDGETFQTNYSLGATTFSRGNSLSLATQHWRLATLNWLLNTKGVPVVANGEPYTEAETSFHFPRVAEIDSTPSSVHVTNLYTPIGFGEPLSTSYTEADLAQQIRRNLDYAALYYYYETGITMTHANLSQYMFPFTPMFIQPGVMIGTDRILLSKAASITWGDGSSATMTGATVHVFDENGVEEPSTFVAGIISRNKKNGATANGYMDVKLPVGYTAAIIHP